MKTTSFAIVLISFVLFNSLTIVAQKSPNLIKGTVKYNGSTLSNVHVQLKDAEVSTNTNKLGKYEILALPMNTLVFSKQGLKNVEIVVEYVTSILNIEMLDKIIELNEVVVKNNKISKQEQLRINFPINKNIYRTVFGYADYSTSGFSARIIDGNKLNAGAYDFISALNGRIPNARVVTNPNGSKGLILRGNASFFNNATAIYDVDGLITLTPPDFIQPEDIDRIVVLASKGATVKYGSVGAGGVIVVNTKSGNYVSEPGKKEPYDRAKLRNNAFVGDALVDKDRLQNLPSYLMELKESSSMKIAKEVYSKYSKNYKSNPYFFIDSFSYFEQEGQSKYAFNILDEGKVVLSSNPVYTKALAYILEANGYSKLANEQYEKIFIMRPNYAQSYRDLAESYRDIGNVKKAANMYARYSNVIAQGLKDSDSIMQPILERDFNNLLALKGNEVLEGEKEIVNLNKTESFQGNRLLFEWNDSEAEFELQFVNPDNRFHTWKHTMESNAARIKEEKFVGFSCEEFLLDNSSLGNWKVNVKYNGNKKLSSTYLKVTTYYNYGTLSQRKEINVYRLGLKNANQKLFNLINSNAMVRN